MLLLYASFTMNKATKYHLYIIINHVNVKIVALLQCVCTNDSFD